MLACVALVSFGLLPADTSASGSDRVVVEIVDVTTDVSLCGCWSGWHYVTMRVRVVRTVHGGLRPGAEVTAAFYCSMVPRSRDRGRPRPADYQGMWWGDRLTVDLMLGGLGPEEVVYDQFHVRPSSIYVAQEIQARN